MIPNPCHDATELIFNTIGSPIGSGTYTPSPTEVDGLLDYAFKGRVGLLFLEECSKKGVALAPRARELYESLRSRRLETNRVIVKLATALDEVARGEWVLFKSIKPFASTPNDTDWFPLDPRRHAELCDHLQATGEFELLEVAPLQTTLIEVGGRGMTDTTKKGGIYYIDCYVCPSTDHFIYFDPKRFGHGAVRHVEIDGYSVPTLDPGAELAVSMFHNVFPERSFSFESYYFAKVHLESMERDGSLESFPAFCTTHHVGFAVSLNLAMIRDVDRVCFGVTDDRVAFVLRNLGYSHLEVKGFDPKGRYPYEIPNRYFWLTFLKKQSDWTSLRSTLVQAVHMLNPVFFVDVMRVLWKRCVRGGVYEQN